MKKFLYLALSIAVLASCKSNDEKPVPDDVLTTPADTIRKDTLADVNETTNEPVTTVDQVIEVVPAKNKPVTVEYASFGSKIIADKALTKEEMLRKFKSMKKGDTLAIKFKSTITEVCKKKGCWMKMDLPDGRESFVRFKDYGFFVPLNADNSDAIVSGRAYLDVVSVDELKHYAKDGGESQDAIDKIVSPKVTYAFQADGVLIQQ